MQLISIDTTIVREELKDIEHGSGPIPPHRRSVAPSPPLLPPPHRHCPPLPLCATPTHSLSPSPPGQMPQLYDLESGLRLLPSGDVLLCAWERGGAR